tara:strand:+ start:675 stop:1811 length:1137 start_codon:yes stop_codon:yes gene_type:complete
MNENSLKVVVTGAAGFIGKNLIKKLVSKNYQVIGIDSLSTQIHGNDPKLDYDPVFSNNKFKFIKADFNKIEKYEEYLKNADLIYHLAAETGTGQSMYMAKHYFEVNVNSTINLVDYLIKNCPKSHFIFASSRSIYGEGAYLLDNSIVVPESRSYDNLAKGDFSISFEGRNDLELIPTPESCNPKPASVYALTKYVIENYLDIVSKSYDMKCTSLRFQNVYGPGQSLKNPYTGILSIFANKMRVNETINIFEDGLESRDFVFIEDVVTALMSSRKRGGNIHEKINIGSGLPTSVLDIANFLKRTLNSDSKIEITGDFRLGDIRHCYADLNLARKILNYKPSYTIEKGISLFVSWVLSQEIEKDNSDKAMLELKRYGISK